jgi:nitrate/nitrite transporter NarK
MDPVPTTAYDPARALTYGALFGVIVLTLFICVMIGIQVWDLKPISTEFVSALTFMMGWLTSEAGGIFSNRFGSTAQSQLKDATIQQQAQTAAIVAGAAPPVVAVPTAAAIHPAPIKADIVQVDAQTANVTEAPAKDAP